MKGEEEHTGPSEEMLEIEIPFQSKPCRVRSAPIKRMSKVHLISNLSDLHKQFCAQSNEQPFH